MEDKEASESLVTMGIFSQDEIAPVMGGQPDLKLIHPDVKETKFIENKVNRFNLLENGEYLSKRSQNSDAANWFRSLYIWLHKYPAYEPCTHRVLKKYHIFEIILTSEKQLLTGDQVFLLDNLSVVADISDHLLISKPVLNPGIFAVITDEEKRKDIRGFLINFTGVQGDSKRFCKDILLPKILTNAPKPTPKDLVKCTIYCQQILGDEIPEECEFWIFTKRGDIRPAKEVIFSKEFNPEQDWETYQQYVSGCNFISPCYIEGIPDDQLERWRKFFEKGGVKDAPNNGVEEFAMKYVEGKLKANTEIRNVTTVDKRNFGYDMEAESKTGKKMYIEVKGKSPDGDIELTGNETDAADKYAEDFYLYVVSSIPNNPELHIVPNPAKVGKKDKLTISVTKWKSC